MRSTVMSYFVLVATGCGGAGGDAASPDRVAAATVKLASCSGLSPVRFSLLSLPIMTSADVTCAADAANCADALACVGMRIASSCPMTPTCIDGDTLLECIGSIGYEIDCNAWHGHGGPSCLTNTNRRGQCGARTCTTAAESCDGSTRIDCDSGVEQTFDCAVLGESCSTIGTGTECATISASTCSGPSHCDGNDVVQCEAGVELRLACSKFVDNAECILDGNDAFCGYGMECSPSLSLPGEICEGTMLRFCLLGRSVAVDCAALGFTGCASDSLSTRCR